jgi:hypothetical protein
MKESSGRASRTIRNPHPEPWRLAEICRSRIGLRPSADNGDPLAASPSGVGAVVAEFMLA